MKKSLLIISTVVATACTPRASTTDTDITSDVGRAAVALDRSDSVEFRDLRKLEAVLKGKRIVLLGENGHGVGDFTVHKARIVRFLHERLGFDVIAFESPFDDCARANAAIETLGAVRAAQSCLLVQLQHAEIRPLFDYMRASHATGKPLAFAGLDLQISLFSARARPGAIRTQLGARNSRLAAELAALDSTLIELTFKGVDSVQTWIPGNGARMAALLDSAVTLTDGHLQRVLATERALLGRLQLRTGAVSPVPYYESRDVWMARMVRWLADSTGTRRKIAVWLHNDHGRYGLWATPSGPAQSTGRLLRAWYGGAVYSVGLFMGRGQVADNSRRVRDVRPIETGSLEALLSATNIPALWLDLSKNNRIRQWFQRTLTYTRAGLAADTMAFGREFDGIIYIDSVGPPNFGIR